MHGLPEISFETWFGAQVRHTAPTVLAYGLHALGQADFEAEQALLKVFEGLARMSEPPLGHDLRVHLLAAMRAELVGSPPAPEDVLWLTLAAECSLADIERICALPPDAAARAMADKLRSEDARWAAVSGPDLKRMLGEDPMGTAGARSEVEERDDDRFRDSLRETARALIQQCRETVVLSPLKDQMMATFQRLESNRTIRYQDVTLNWSQFGRPALLTACRAIRITVAVFMPALLAMLFLSRLTASFATLYEDMSCSMPRMTLWMHHVTTRAGTFVLSATSLALASIPVTLTLERPTFTFTAWKRSMERLGNGLSSPIYLIGNLAIAYAALLAVPISMTAPLLQFSSIFSNGRTITTIASIFSSFLLLTGAVLLLLTVLHMLSDGDRSRGKRAASEWPRVTHRRTAGAPL